MGRQRIRSPRAEVVTGKNDEFTGTIAVEEKKDGKRVRILIKDWVVYDDYNLLFQEHITRHTVRRIRDEDNMVYIEDLKRLFEDPSARDNELERQKLHLKAVMPPKALVPSPPASLLGLLQPNDYKVDLKAAMTKCREQMIPLSAPVAVNFTNALAKQTRYFPTNEEIARYNYRETLAWAVDRLSYFEGTADEQAFKANFILAPPPTAARYRRLRMLKRAEMRGEKRWRWRVEKKARRDSI
ncbi:MAG: hypothetical protein LQ351_005241 [Letrouitia transgressa]|nr:MAG: hypothetical protein LQ351_005241 [Letrouitia transgressa]